MGTVNDTTKHDEQPAHREKQVSDDVEFFETAAEFHKWLAKNHDKVDVRWVGFYKVDTEKPSITWPQSVDQALCFGWIDGLRKKIDDDAYKVRFTPRRPGSKWSAKNLARVKRLIADHRMQPPGLREYEKRKKETADYSYEERKDAKLTLEYEKRFKTNKAAWNFLQEQAPWYRRTAAHWVMAAKKEQTRLRRLQQLIDHSAARRAIPPLAPGKHGDDER